MATPTDDSELVMAALSGDREAWGDLYERHGRRLSARLASMGLGAACEDVLHEAFLRGWRSLEGLKDGAAFGGWIEAIAVNLARSRLARRPKGNVAGSPASGRLDEADPAAADPAKVLEVADALDSLPEEMRTVIELRFKAGLSYDEIASRLDITRDNVAVRLHRARGKLRELLGN